MKKSFIIPAIALSLSVMTLSATTSTKELPTSTTIESVVKVNSFCMAIAKGDVITVKKLIEMGEDVNQKSNGMTPLMYAAKYNRVEILKVLISKGAKLKTRSDKKYTALGYAKLSNAKEALVLLEKAMKKKK